MNPKEFLKLEKDAKVSFEDWNKLKDYIFKMYLRIDELLISREKWKEKFMELKNKLNSPQ